MLKIGYVKIVAKQMIPGYSLISNLPEENIIHHLIIEDIVREVAEPKKFRKGLIVLISINLDDENDLLLLIVNEKGYNKITKTFKRKSIKWFEINEKKGS